MERWIRVGIVLFVGLAGLPGNTSAQEPFEEEPDPTRLDVERLPPEAIEITRDLYAHGLFLEAGAGVRGFVTGIGELSDPGLYATFGLGAELTRWLWFKVSFEGSIHQTDAPAPPTSTVFELLGLMAELRLQINASARAALFLGVEAGISWATTDVLDTYGLGQSDDLGVVAGGQLGFDWHFQNRHHSLGLVSGARAYPSLKGPTGDIGIGVHGAAYLRYVF